MISGAVMGGVWPIPIDGTYAMIVGSILAFMGLLLIVTNVMRYNSPKGLPKLNASEVLTVGIYQYSGNPQIRWGVYSPHWNFDNRTLTPCFPAHGDTHRQNWPL